VNVVPTFRQGMRNGERLQTPEIELVASGARIRPESGDSRGIRGAYLVTANLHFHAHMTAHLGPFHFILRGGDGHLYPPHSSSAVPVVLRAGRTLGLRIEFDRIPPEALRHATLRVNGQIGSYVSGVDLGIGLA